MTCDLKNLKVHHVDAFEGQPIMSDCLYHIVFVSDSNFYSLLICYGYVSELQKLLSH